MTPSQRLSELETRVQAATILVRSLIEEKSRLNREFRSAQETCAFAHSELDMYRRYMIREGLIDATAIHSR